MFSSVVLSTVLEAYYVAGSIDMQIVRKSLISGNMLLLFERSVQNHFTRFTSGLVLMTFLPVNAVADKNCM